METGSRVPGLPRGDTTDGATHRAGSSGRWTPRKERKAEGRQTPPPYAPDSGPGEGFGPSPRDPSRCRENPLREPRGSPYRKPTQVDGARSPRCLRQPRRRNSANYPRNFGIRGAPFRDPAQGERREAAEKWQKRLFTKNTGPCEPAMGSIWSDTCPVPEG